MNEWIPVGLTVSGNVVALGVMWGRMTSKIETLEARMNEHEDESDDTEKSVSRLTLATEKLQTSLFGFDGQNGMRSNLNDVSVKVEAVKEQLSDIRSELKENTGRQSRIEQRLDELIDRLAE